MVPSTALDLEQFVGRHREVVRPEMHYALDKRCGRLQCVVRAQRQQNVLLAVTAALALRRLTYRALHLVNQ